MKTQGSVRLTTILATTALLGAAVAVNCSKSADNSGVVRLALHVSPDFTVNSVHWQINSATSTDVKHGDINTSDINSTASVDTSLTAGSGYRVVMTATATDSHGVSVSCMGSSPAPGFNVTAGASVMVGVSLICGGSMNGSGSGSVVVTGTVIAGDNCPVLTSWEASPLQTSSGGQINVSAAATDADTATGQTISYAWTADSGTFADATAPTTVYNCGAPTLNFSGSRLTPPHTLTVTVSDSYTPPCTTTMTFSVDCVSPSECGNGIVEPPAETCDPPNGTTCGANCLPIQFCGDGVVQSPEQCDQGAANQPAGVTYGTVAAHCSSTCTTLPYCGDGVVNGSEGCDPPGSTTPTGGTCDATCHTQVCLASDACTVCEQADTVDCPAAINVVPGGTGCFGCDGFLGQARTDCQTLLTCIRTTNCANGDDTTPCLCGTLTPAVCASSGAPATAACATQYAAAAADFPGTVFSQFGDPRSPVGIANNQAACRIDSGCACP